MLGSNLGKKVTAGVVQDEYKQFLKTNDTKKTLTPEERKQAKRAEMRRKGVFVKADDPDETPTILEKAEGQGPPVLFVLPEKPTLWKRSKKTTATRKHKKSAKRKEKKAEHEVSGPPKKKTKTPKKEVSSKHIKTPDTSAATTPVVQTPEAKRHEEKVEKLEEKREVVEVKTEPAVTEQKVEKKQSGEQQKVEEVKKPEEKPEEKVEEKAAEEPASTGMKPEDVPKPPRDGKREYASLTAVSSNPSMTEMKKAIPMAEKQTDAFDKLDDDEFEKMTSDADEKEILKLAPRLLKVAKKHAAIEKCLTSEENEVLAKFFSGKQKLDANVLAILDAALDKIIDYLQKNNCAVDEETKAVMKKRDKLKAAMMKEFLVSPQYLPKMWTAKFNEWKTEAEKQKNGVNWFRVCFSYPKHKSFDDGPEDTFGNFRRRHRGLLMGLILGPGDVKSFEETKREDDCQGMFLDTKMIEKAADTTTTVSSSISTNIATAVSDPRSALRTPRGTL